MSDTLAESDGGTDGRTKLARAIEDIDTKFDSRDCPHECHGTLSTDDDGRVLCETCRCTPDGVYLPPENDEDGGAVSEPSKSDCSQYLFFEGGYPRSSTFNPKGSEWDNHLAEPDHTGDLVRATYRNSGKRKVVGSFEKPWSQEKLSREDSLI